MTNRFSLLPRSSRALFVILAATLLAVATAHAQQETPTRAFNAYRKTLSTATTYRDVLPLTDATGRTMIGSMPEPAQARMFELLKKFAGTYTDVTVTKRP